MARPKIVTFSLSHPHPMADGTVAPSGTLFRVDARRLAEFAAQYDQARAQGLPPPPVPPQAERIAMAVPSLLTAAQEAAGRSQPLPPIAEYVEARAAALTAAGLSRVQVLALVPGWANWLPVEEEEEA